MPREEVQRAPEITVLFVSKRGCGICELFRSVFRRLKDDRPGWTYNEIHLLSETEAKDLLKMYPMMTQTPFTALLVDGTLKGTVNGTMRYLPYLAKLDEFVNQK